MILNKNKLKKLIMEALVGIIGAIIIALGISMFLLPNQLSSGGVTGIATIVYYLLNIPMGKTILLLNIPMFILAMYKLGKGLFVKSIIGTVALSIFTDYFDKFGALTNDKLLASIYGGIIVGLGTAILLKAKSSTGGTELFSQLVKQYNPNIRMGSIITMIDIVIVGLNVIFFRQIQVGLYSFIAIYLVGKMVDIVFEGIYFTKLLFIVSDKTEEIAKEIGLRIHRGTTGLYGKGMFTSEEKLVLMCASARGDVAKVKEIAEKIDPNCFIIITNSREVLGEGFKKT